MQFHQMEFTHQDLAHSKTKLHQNNKMIMQIQGEEKHIDTQDKVLQIQINHLQGLHPEVVVQTVTRVNTDTEDTNTGVAAQHQK